MLFTPPFRGPWECFGRNNFSHKKLQPPDTEVICLGILLNPKTRIISIPPPNLQETVDLCEAWHKKSSCIKTELQSLLGYFLYITKCVKPQQNVATP